MFPPLKAAVRDSLPRRYQLQLMFWYSKRRGDLELEMVLLPILAEIERRAKQVRL